MITKYDIEHLLLPSEIPLFPIVTIKWCHYNVRKCCMVKRTRQIIWCRVTATFRRPQTTISYWESCFCFPISIKVQHIFNYFFPFFSYLAVSGTILTTDYHQANFTDWGKLHLIGPTPAWSLYNTTTLWYWKDKFNYFLLFFSILNELILQYIGQSWQQTIIRQTKQRKEKYTWLDLRLYSL